MILEDFAQTLDRFEKLCGASAKLRFEHHKLGEIFHLRSVFKMKSKILNMYALHAWEVILGSNGMHLIFVPPISLELDAARNA